MESITVLQLAGVAIFTLIATVTDLQKRKIPNWLTVSAAVLGLVFHVSTSGVSGLWFSLGGFGTGFGMLLVLWLIGGGGGGDVKLMGAIGAWLGPMNTLLVFVLSVIFAIVCLFCVMVYGAIGSSKAGDKTSSVLKKTIPYAVPCGLSTWSILLVRFFTQQ